MRVEEPQAFEEDRYTQRRPWQAFEEVGAGRRGGSDLGWSLPVVFEQTSAAV